MDSMSSMRRQSVAWMEERFLGRSGRCGGPSAWISMGSSSVRPVFVFELRPNDGIWRLGAGRNRSERGFPRNPALPPPVSPFAYGRPNTGSNCWEKISGVTQALTPPSSSRLLRPAFPNILSHSKFVFCLACLHGGIDLDTVLDKFR